MRVAVVGSGLAGCVAAEQLLQCGHQVVVIDAGHGFTRCQEDFGRGSYLDFRGAEENQWPTLLGAQFEVLTTADQALKQVTPSRLSVFHDPHALNASQCASFSKVESFASGGLGNAWGLACYVMSAPELISMGLEPAAFRSSYEALASRMGLSGARCDLRDGIAGGLSDEHVDSPLPLDRLSKRMMAAYETHLDWFRNQGIALDTPLLALLSQDRLEEGRSRSDLSESDFYENRGAAAFRPEVMERILGRHPLCEIRYGVHVESFENSTTGGVSLNCHDCIKSENSSHAFDRVILCAGNFGSFRVVANSMGDRGFESTRFLAQPYAYIPSIHFESIGKRVEDATHSLCQLQFARERGVNVTHEYIVSIYGYRSLLLWRLLRDTPLGVSQALPLWSWLHSGLRIAGVHFPDVGGVERCLRLLPPQGKRTPTLKITSDFQNRQWKQFRGALSDVKSALRRLGCQPLATILQRDGSSTHTGGSLAFSGLLHPNTNAVIGHENVFVADASVFRALPPKGLTFTIMAYAHQVGRNVATGRC